MAIDPDLAAVLEDPDGVDQRDLCLHTLAAMIEDPSWPASLKQVPPVAFHRLCAWLPIPAQPGRVLWC